MKAYKVIQTVEEIYYIFADTEDDAMAKLYSGECDPRKIEEIGVAISEVEK